MDKSGGLVRASERCYMKAEETVAQMREAKRRLKVLMPFLREISLLLQATASQSDIPQQAQLRLTTRNRSKLTMILEQAIQLYKRATVTGGAAKPSPCAAVETLIGMDVSSYFNAAQLDLSSNACLAMRRAGWTIFTCVVRLLGMFAVRCRTCCPPQGSVSVHLRNGPLLRPRR